MTLLKRLGLPLLCSALLVGCNVETGTSNGGGNGDGGNGGGQTDLDTTGKIELSKGFLTSYADFQASLSTFYGPAVEFFDEIEAGFTDIPEAETEAMIVVMFAVFGQIAEFIQEGLEGNDWPTTSSYSFENSDYVVFEGENDFSIDGSGIVRANGSATLDGIEVVFDLDLALPNLVDSPIEMSVAMLEFHVYGSNVSLAMSNSSLSLTLDGLNLGDTLVGEQDSIDDISTLALSMTLDSATLMLGSLTYEAEFDIELRDVEDSNYDSFVAAFTLEVESEGALRTADNRYFATELAFTFNYTMSIDEADIWTLDLSEYSATTELKVGDDSVSATVSGHLTYTQEDRQESVLDGNINEGNKTYTEHFDGSVQLHLTHNTNTFGIIFELSAMDEFIATWTEEFDAELGDWQDTSSSESSDARYELIIIGTGDHADVSLRFSNDFDSMSKIAELFVQDEHIANMVWNDNTDELVAEFIVGSEGPFVIHAL
ncbi:hypothetical protein NFC81_06410 [Salinispirillum sp. LH 10-3-1]|uniref:Uncharacterized protein n=1 Tax=Salinispirillum sp. LH 10-3-1 TaxID=2952525 RepID=A0AB38YJC9_9GAMM